VTGREVLPSLTFVLPSNRGAVSGGNIYNRELLRALRKRVRVRAVSGNAWTRSLEGGEPGVYFLDTLNLRESLALGAARSGQRFVLIVHHLPSLEPGVADGDEALAVERQALPRFDAFLATSPFTAQWLVNRGCASQGIMTVLPAPPKAEPHTERAYEPPLRALIVGNLIARKAILEFMQTLEGRVASSDRFIVDVLGRIDIDPAYARACVDLANNSERLCRRVRILGPVAHRRVGAFYRRAHIMVSAAEMETFGMALQEARAFGLPILALDRGYARHHFSDEENGLLYASRSALVDGFLRLTREPERMLSLFEGAQRLRLSGDYTWETAAERLLDELSRCLGAG
jgi:glycosyltransferase involved in cell wall biosynthesis